MECPTCFQKITVPQATATEDSKFIITGTKVGERPVSNIPEYRAAEPEKRSPLAAVIVAVILVAAGAAGYVYRGTILKLVNPPAAPTSAPQTPAAVAPSSPPLPVVVVQTNLPLPPGTNYWTLDVNMVGTPDVPAAGKVHGRYFKAERMILNKDGLTIRTADFPPVAGTTIYLQPNPIEGLFGKSLLFETNTPGTPAVYLRWKNAQGREMDEVENNGYALRIEFGNPVSNYISGKIYLCTPDEMQSYVVGRFNAEIIKPKPQ
jgi:hypothetical protein